jgi:hypothetical protein
MPLAETVATSLLATRRADLKKHWRKDTDSANLSFLDQLPDDFPGLGQSMLSAKCAARWCVPHILSSFAAEDLSAKK